MIRNLSPKTINPKAQQNLISPAMPARVDLFRTGQDSARSELTNTLHAPHPAYAIFFIFLPTNPHVTNPASLPTA